MGYFIRFLTQSSNPVDVTAIYNALVRKDPRYVITQDDPDSRKPSKFKSPESFKDQSWGLLVYSRKVYGSITVCPKGSEYFGEDIALLRGNTSRSSAENAQEILQFLEGVNCLVALQVLGEGWEDNNPGIIKSLFDWLFDNYGGLLHVQNEGYYEKDDVRILDTSDCEMNYIDAVLRLSFRKWYKIKYLETFIRRVYPEYLIEIQNRKCGHKMDIIWKEVKYSKLRHGRLF